MSSNPQSVAVRAIQPSDEAQWRQLWLGYQDFYEVTLSEEVTRSTFHRFLDPDEPVFSAVAVQGDQLLGFVNSVVHRSTWAVTDYCYLEDLYVSPATRGAGTGKLLIEWVQRFARQRQCAKLYWHTHKTNKRAQKLYNWVARQSGFIEYRMTV
ncbi:MULTISPECIES: GNAT family N-acetyltransferase [Polaromonas]|uniref:N-acetyltransferase family protein n=1 Tax=Polaromonas aquatica TaxID=332657 RepID=A0ABW1U4K0_9BURK